MRWTVAACVALSLACGVQSSRSSRSACDAASVLSQLANSLMQTDGSLNHLLLTSQDIDRLNGATSVASRTSEFDRLVEASVEKDADLWRRKLNGYTLENVIVGHIQQKSVEGLAPSVEILTDSVLTFRSGESIVAVPVEALYRVGHCWKLVEIGTGQSSTAVEAAEPAASSLVSCFSEEELLTHLARALLSNEDIENVLTQVGDLTSIGISVGDAEALTQSIRFDASNDANRWKRELGRGTIVGWRVAAWRNEANWLGTGTRATVAEGELIVSTVAGSRRLRVRELAKFGGCTRLIWLGSPPP